MNDPCHGTTLLICVAVWNDDMSHKQIVSSCRIFLKKVSMGGGRFAKAGGIGEVCTNPVHLRHGLSKALLKTAVKIMKERQLVVSLLHAAPTFFPVHEALGYSRSQSKWAPVSLSLLEIENYFAA
jgi:predicted acetyltransferase